MNRLNPYINFGGKCREAMSFYRDVLGGELNLMSVGESPAPCESAEDAKLIMHSSLEFGHSVLMGTDMGGAEMAKPQGQIAMALSCTSEEEIEILFAKLLEGGNVMHPLHDAFWGGKFGVGSDKYGIVWMFNYEKK